MVDMTVNVTIPAEHVPACLKAINGLFENAVMEARASGGKFAEGWAIERWYSFVDSPPPGGYPSLVEALRCWRYEAQVRNDGAVEMTAFSGTKWGDCEVLYGAISRFAVGRIEVRGEDECTWSYRFDRLPQPVMHGDKEGADAFAALFDGLIGRGHAP